MPHRIGLGAEIVRKNPLLCRAGQTKAQIIVVRKRADCVAERKEITYGHIFDFAA